MSRGELKELAASSAMHVERVCTLYSCIEQLVTSESVKPELTSMPLVPVLADVVDGVSLLFDDKGMSLKFRASDICAPVLINRERTVQALSSVLVIAEELSRAPDAVELIASSSSEGIRVTVRNANSFVDALDAETRLRMDIAETNMRSQGAGFEWSLQPFDVQIELKNATPNHSC